MRYKVLSKQPNTRMCLVCGLDNQAGLRTSFFELENSELLGIFHSINEHQSYPGRLHGGIAAAILDETIGRAIMVKYGNDIWGVTLEFSSRYKKPLPVNQKLRAITRITNDENRFFMGTGEILLDDGTVAVEATGKYMKLPYSKIAASDMEHMGWEVRHSPDDPVEIEI